MKSTNIIITIIVLILIAAGSYTLMNNQSDEMMVKDDKMMQKDEMMVKDDTVIKNETMQKEPMMKGGIYESYSIEKLANANSGDVVLFFKASWCPSCRTVDADIRSNLDKIPKDLTLLELDYDKSFDLKKKYGVTSQHTFVQVDSDGNMLKKWSGGSTLMSIIKEII